MVKNPPANAGDTGLTLVWEDPTYRGETKPMNLLKQRSGGCAPQQEKSLHREACEPQPVSSPHSMQLEKSPSSNEDPVQPKKKKKKNHSVVHLKLVLPICHVSILQ